MSNPTDPSEVAFKEWWQHNYAGVPEVYGDHEQYCEEAWDAAIVWAAGRVSTESWTLQNGVSRIVELDPTTPEGAPDSCDRGRCPKKGIHVRTDNYGPLKLCLEHAQEWDSYEKEPK